MTDDTDLLIRIRPREGSAGAYAVELELGDGGRFPGGSLTIDATALEAVLNDNPAYGELLFDALFDKTVRPGYDRAIAAAAAAGAGVSIRLLVESGATDLEATRWERMYRDRNGTPVAFATGGDTPFSRYRASQAPEPRPVATRPIQVLLVVSSPGQLPARIGAPDRSLDSVDVDREVRTFRDAVRDAAGRDDLDVRILVERQRLDPGLAAELEQEGFRILDRRPTLQAFVRELLGTHVVHFIGHGIRTRAPGPGGVRDAALLFERDGDERYEPVDAATLVERFAAAEVAPGLVFLAACHSGETDPGPHAFVGIGPRLVDAGVGAVVAMQDVIAMDTARALTTTFYADLLETGVVDRALNHARLVVYRGDSADWSVPALFSRLRRGRLFVHRELANQVIADDVALTPGPEHGVVARRLVEVPQPRLRQLPVRLLPRDFPGLIGRESEVATALDTVRAGSFMEFHGPFGAGKSVLLRHVANRVGDLVASGVVHVRNGAEPIEDLLLFLFDALYEADASLRPTDADVRRLLAACDPVIAVDDIDLPREALEDLLNAVPKGRFLLATRDRNLWGEGEVVALGGLSADAALALFEDAIGRALTPSERTAATAICAGLAGLPLYIVQAAAQAAEGRWPSPPASPPGPIGGVVRSPVAPAAIAALGPEAREVLGLIAAADAPLGTEHIEAVLELEDAGPACAELEAAGLVRRASPQYVLTEPLGQEVQADLNVPDLRQRLVAHIAAWVRQNQNSPRRVVRDLDVILAILSRAFARPEGRVASGDVDDVLRIARGAEGALILSKRWRRWQMLLDEELEIARDTHDDAGVAWALHQTGSRALALRDETTARRSLTEALRIRERLGDEAGAAVTRENLRLLDGLPTDGDREDPGEGPGVETDGKRKERTPPRWRWLRWLLGGGLLAVAVVASAALAMRPPVPPPAEHHPVPRFEPSSIDLGSVEIGSTVEAAIAISNGGDADWLISAPQLEPNLDEMVIDTDCPSSLTTDSTCTLTIRFAPAAAGERLAAVVITDNSTTGRQEIPIRGVGVPPPGEPAVAIEPGALTFDVIRPGEAASQSVTVSSVGTADVTIGAVGPIDSPDFGVVSDPCSQVVLAPGVSCEIMVEFHPTTGGDLSAILSIGDDASDAAHEVELRGTGLVLRPDIVISYDDIGRQYVGDDGRVHTEFYGTLRNIGEVDAPPFAIAAQYVDPKLEDPTAPQRATLEGIAGYPLEPVEGGLLRTFEPLPPGREIFFSADVVYPFTMQGRHVELTVVVDPCPPTAIVTACEVDEIDEANNATPPIPFDLPASVLFLERPR